MPAHTIADLVQAGHAIRQAKDQAQQASKDVAQQLGRPRPSVPAPEQPERG